MSGTTVPCSRCGGTLRFIRTRKGKAMPVEPVPDPHGNVAALRTSSGRYVDGHVITVGAPVQDGYVVFMPHYAVCRPAPVIKPVVNDDGPGLF